MITPDLPLTATSDAHRPEIEVLIAKGLLPDPNAMTVDCSRWPEIEQNAGNVLAAEYEQLLHRLASRLDLVAADRDDLHRKLARSLDHRHRLHQALDYLAAYHPLTPAQRAMVDHLATEVVDA